MLAFVQLAMYRSATGAGVEGGLTVVLLALVGFVVAYALWTARRASRLIEQAVRNGGRMAGTMIALACLLVASACGPGYGADEPGREPAPEPASEPTSPPEAMPARAYPEPGAAVDPDSALRAELIEMGREDQRVRTGLTPEMIADTAFVRRLMRTDSALSIRLREMIETHGWPDAERVGQSAVHAAFLIVQHSPFDDFRQAMLPHVEQDAKAGVLDAQDYAAMVDRIRTHRGEPQLYGTQYSLVDGYLIRDPVENADDLERRREELGLMPVAEYERLLADFYGAEVRSAP